MLRHEDVSVTVREYISLTDPDDSGQLIVCIEQNDFTEERVVTMVESMYTNQAIRNEKLEMLDNNERVYIGYSYKTWKLEMYSQDEITTVPLE